MNSGVMLNAYPDSMGSSLHELVSLLSQPEMKDAFRSFYILPTVFNSDLDGGFSVITYDLCRSKASEEDLHALNDLGIDLTFDFILNHLSVLSPQFRDVLKKGDQSPYRDFFIDWNRFWQGCGQMTREGWIAPDPDQWASMTLRKNGWPLLMVRFPDGRDVPYWNTFYQQVTYPQVDAFDLLDAVDNRYDAASALSERINAQLTRGLSPAQMDWTGYEAYQEPVTALMESRRHYLGQMDVNVQNPLVWQWYDQVMGQLASYGAVMIRLDAFTRLHKAPARVNFMNEPETWDILQRLRTMAASHGLDVLPEIHATYASGNYRHLTDLGCITYDYFLPALMIDALDTRESRYLYAWAREQIDDGLTVINMLGCHDGIPMRDARGLLPNERVDALTERLVTRGGRRKMIHGARPETYQMDITYYNALGCDDRKLLMARAVQLFMPGKPQVWYLDLLAGENDEEVFRRNPTADNREINRTAFTMAQVKERLQKPVVRDQLKLLTFRNTHPAFAQGAQVEAEQPEAHTLRLTWRKGEAWASLYADFRQVRWDITTSNGEMP